MPSFEITASHAIDRSGGLHIDKGQTFTININMMGITPVNLFNYTRCAHQLVNQYKLNGIDVSKSDAGIYCRGAWDIKMV